MTKTEGNKLIADFMGYEYVTLSDNLRYYMIDGVGYSEHLLKYHLSWDWLMLVVEKIESTENSDDYEVDIFGNCCDIGGKFEAVGKTKKEATWNAILQFIEDNSVKLRALPDKAIPPPPPDRLVREDKVPIKPMEDDNYKKVTILGSRVEEYINGYAWNYGRFYHVGSAHKIVELISQRMMLPHEFFKDIVLKLQALESVIKLTDDKVGLNSIKEILDYFIRDNNKKNLT